MEAQVIRTHWTRRTSSGRQTYRRGEIIEVSSEELEAGVASGELRPADERGQALPPANHGFQDPRPTTPAGKPIDLPADTTAAIEGEVPKTHAEADAIAETLGVTFPSKTKLDDKVVAIQAMRTAQAAGETPPVAIDISEMDDRELIEYGQTFGLQEDELAELGHDELVLKVSEAMSLRTADPAAQTEIASNLE